MLSSFITRFTSIISKPLFSIAALKRSFSLRGSSKPEICSRFQGRSLHLFAMNLLVGTSSFSRHVHRVAKFLGILHSSKYSLPRESYISHNVFWVFLKLRLNHLLLRLHVVVGERSSEQVSHVWWAFLQLSSWAKKRVGKPLSLLRHRCWRCC